MKLILNSDVAKLGRKGDIVDVAKGYARNYLLPKNLAIVATDSNILIAEKIQEKRIAEKVLNEVNKNIYEFISEITNLEVVKKIYNFCNFSWDKKSLEFYKREK